MSITPELPVHPWAHEYSSSQNFQVGPRITWIIVSSRFIQRWADFLDSKEEYGMYLIQIYTDDIIYDTNNNLFNVFVNTYSCIELFPHSLPERIHSVVFQQFLKNSMVVL